MRCSTRSTYRSRSFRHRLGILRRGPVEQDGARVHVEPVRIGCSWIADAIQESKAHAPAATFLHCVSQGASFVAPQNSLDAKTHLRPARRRRVNPTDV